MNERQAKPKAHVAYQREAWICTQNNSVRVTMDREVRCEPDPTTLLRTEMKNPVYVFGNKVVLELKFTGRFPDWFKDMVRLFGLTQCSAAKYVDGVALIGEARVAHAGHSLTSNPVAAALSRERRREVQELGGVTAVKLGVA
jgi:VTC domain